MPNFQNLKNILDMDFKQMRTLKASEGMRATDDAILLFVNNLIDFYSQFSKEPTKAELQEYKTYMEQITKEINNSEYAYYLDKYTVEDPENAEQMASGCKLKSYKDLPTRMQYWAASEEFGGTIRNAENHKIATSKFKKWAALIDSHSKNLFFNLDEEEKQGSKPHKFSFSN